MKRAFRFVVAAAVVLFVALGSVSSLLAAESDSSAGGIPAPIQRARSSVMDMENTIVGIGTARLQTINESRTAAIDMALGDIGLQIEVRVEYMSRTYESGAEGDDKEGVLVTESVVRRTHIDHAIRGAVITEEYLSPDGQYWVAIMLSSVSQK